jgi:hypothetical protein
VRRLLLALLLLALAPASANADTSTLSASEDTFVRSDQPTSAFGSTTPLHVDGQIVGDAGNPERQSYLRFNGTPTGATSAVLRLHIPFPTAEGYQVRSLSCAGWNGSTTYNTRPALGTVLVNAPAGTANAYNSITLPAPPSGSACYALTKTGSNWMTVSSRESTTPPQLVVTYTPPAPTPTPTPSPTPTPPPTTSGVAKCGTTPISVTPANWRTALNSASSVVLNAAPGTYSNLSMADKTCVEIRCAVTAKVGEGPNNSGCLVTGQSNIESIRNVTIENFVIKASGSGDYGFAVYDESPDVNMHIRIAGNVFNGSLDHDISTKERVEWAEVENNIFINCRRHCWEIGQNGNIASRPSTTGTAVFRGNIVSSLIQGVTQRYNLDLRVENNDFRSVAGYAVITEPYWALYPFGASGDRGDLFVPGTQQVSDPKVPLRTTVTGNKFSSGNRLFFTGRGVTDDRVLVSGNTGTVPSCSRGGMNARNSGTSAAHINEQTLNPPVLDPASTVAC